MLLKIVSVSISSMLFLILMKSSHGEWYYTSTATFVVKNSTKRYSGGTLTSCQLKCKSFPNCEQIGWVEQPTLGYVGDCYLLTKGWKKVDTTDNEKTGLISLYILETQTTPPGCEDKDDSVLQEDCRPQPRTTVPPTTTTTSTTTTTTTTPAPAVNIALNKVVSVHDAFSSVVDFTDGNVEQTLYTGTSGVNDFPFIMIDLSSSASISKVRIYVPSSTADQITNSIIYKAASNGVTSDVCGTVTTSQTYTKKPIYVYFDVRCPTDPQFEARYVKIIGNKKKNYLVVSEIEIYG